MALIDFIVELPTANPFRFTLDGDTTNQRADFDQIRYADAQHATVEPREYNQLVERNDENRIQFYTNYPVSRVRIIDCDGETVGSTMVPTLAVAFRGKKYRATARFGSLNDKLFIYFHEGIEYLDEDFEVTGDQLAWLGRLPAINAKVGDRLKFSIDGGDFEFTTISSIAWSPTLQAEGYLTNIDYTVATPVDGLVEVTYDEKPANLYAQLIDFADVPDGFYKIKLEFAAGTSFNVSYTSEPIHLKGTHEQSLAMKYRHDGTFNEDDIWSYIYLSTWMNVLRVPANFFTFVPAGEVEVDVNDHGIPRLIRAVPYREVIFKAMNIPGWLADKFTVAFSHDTKYINGYLHEIENFGEFDLVHPQADLGTLTINLRQRNDRRLKTNDFQENITAEFLPPTHVNTTFEGTTVQSQFVSNTVVPFRFQSLPDWIEVDVDTFENGDIVTFTIAPNAELFERSETLVAISDEILTVEAVVTIHQLYDDVTEPPPPEFLTVSDDTISLPWEGTYQMISVNASGPYTVSNQSGFSFSWDKVSGGINLIIFTNNQNTGVSNRTGVIRLTLDSNPSVFVDIDVTQAYRPKEMVSTNPGLDQTIGEVGELFIISVNTLYPTTKWQASASAADSSWMHFSKTIKTGSQEFEILVDGRPPYIPAGTSMYVHFTNINNPADKVTYTIQRN